MLYQGHRLLCCIRHFWRDVRVWKTNLVVEELARQKRTKLWPKWGISWGLIDVWQSEWSAVNLNHQTVHEIVTFELGMHKICAKLVPKILTNQQKENRRNVCLDLLERIETTKFFSNMPWQVMNRGFLSTIPKSNDKFAVAHEQLTGPEKSKNEQIEKQIHANLFFRLSRCCSYEIRASRTNR